MSKNTRASERVKEIEGGVYKMKGEKKLESGALLSF